MAGNSHPLFGNNLKYKPASSSFQLIATPLCTASLTTSAASVTINYNTQLNNYINACNLQQEYLLQKTAQYIDRISSTVQEPTATLLRDKNTWPAVKQLVVREELMKAQLTGRVDLPIPSVDKQNILQAIKGKDLSSLDDATINGLVDRLTRVDDRSYMDALLQFKNGGQASELLQQSKLDELSKELQNIDLNKITRDQYKHLLENYCERTEFHHRESISSDPNKQSLADNIEVLNTTEHDIKHTDPETGKINYRKPLKEDLLNRTSQMEKANKQRVLRNELRGLGLATAIGIGLGFTLTFISEIAQKGIESDVMSDIAFNSIVAGTESGLVAGATYLAGRSATSLLVNKASIDITTQFGSMLNASAVGLLSTAIVCTYQYVKLRISGANVDESVAVVKKTALSSLSMLTVSIIAQGVWGGHAGLIVSTSIGILYFSANICQNVHAQKIEVRLREYSVEEYKALIDKKSLIYIS